MKEIQIADKQKYLDDNYPFENVPNLTDDKCCLHCDEIFKVIDYKVFKDKSGEEYICCPNTPECNGTVIDWMPIE